MSQVSFPFFLLALATASHEFHALSAKPFYSSEMMALILSSRAFLAKSRLAHVSQQRLSSKGYPRQADTIIQDCLNLSQLSCTFRHGQVYFFLLAREGTEKS